MSDFSNKAHLIGGADVVRLTRATVYSYGEALVTYPDEIINTTITFRMSHSATGALIEREIAINSTDVHLIIEDLSEVYENPVDNSTPQLLQAKIDDSRISVMLVHDDYDTLEVVANSQSDSDDAINHLLFHPTPHPSGKSSVGDISRAKSSKSNRALNSGGFLVRGEDRTSTGINRTLSLLAENTDILESRLRSAIQTDVSRDIPCEETHGSVALVHTPLLGDEVLSTTFTTLRGHLRASGPQDTRVQVLQKLLDAVAGVSYEPAFNTLEAGRNYDFILHEEDREGYAFGTVHGRTAPVRDMDFSYIALSLDASLEAAQALKSQTLNVPAASSEFIQSELYWGRAEYLGTIYGPRYDTRDAQGVYVGAAFVDHYTLRFFERLDALSLVNRGDIIITNAGVFNVDFVGTDNRTIGVRPYSGTYEELLSAPRSDVSYLYDLVGMPATLPTHGNTNAVIILKSTIGAEGEYYGLGKYGHPDTTGRVRTFRVRTLSGSATSTGLDDTLARGYTRMLQELVDPYSSSSADSSIHSVRGLFAVGGLLKLPKVYALPSTSVGTTPVDYLTGSHNFGPLKVGQTSYFKTATPYSVFRGIGGVPSGAINGPLLEENELIYEIARLSLTDYDSRIHVCRDIDSAIFKEDIDAARRVDGLIKTIPGVPQQLELHRVVRRELNAQEHEKALLFYSSVLQVSGRSLVVPDTPIELNADDGLSVRISNECTLSEDDLGRVFILRFDLPDGIKSVRARMHTWTSPKSCRLIPLSDIDFDLAAFPNNVTISPTLGYANLGYGAFNNTVVPKTADVLSELYPRDALSTGTSYQHIYPGTSTVLTLHTAFSASLRIYTKLCALGEASGDASLYALSHAFVVMSNDANTTVQDGDTSSVELNIPNRCPLIPLDKLTFIPFLRSSSQRVRVNSSDLTFYMYAQHALPSVISDFLAFSERTYRDAAALDDVVIGLELQRQAARCELLGYANYSDTNAQYVSQDHPLTSQQYYPTLEAAFQGTLKYLSTTNDGADLPFFGEFGEFYDGIRLEDKALSVSRASGGIRDEDALLLKDVSAVSSTRSVLSNEDTIVASPLNCDDVLVDTLLSAESYLGHYADIAGAYGGPLQTMHTNTSNYALLLHPRVGDAEADALRLWLADARSNPSVDLSVTHYVGLETPTNGAVMRSNTRSWFIATARSGNGGVETFSFAVDRLGYLRVLREFYESGSGADAVFGSFEGFDAVQTPTFQAGEFTIQHIGRAEITVATFGGDVLPVLHTLLKSTDIPYAPTLGVRTVGSIAPVSKELGRTLSSALMPDLVFSSVDEIHQSEIGFYTPQGGTSRNAKYLTGNAYPTTKRVQSGTVDTIAYDSFSNTGADITIYDGEPSFVSQAREDGITVQSLTRGYTDVIGEGDFALRKKTAVHVSSEETVISLKVSHAGIAQTIVDGAAAPVVDLDNRVFSHLAFAGLLVEASGAAWSDAGKSLTSTPTSLTSILGVTRDLRLNAGIPLMAAEKINVTGDAVGLYVPWVGSAVGDVGEPSRYVSRDGEGEVLNTDAVYNIQKGFRNASIVVEGDVAFPERGKSDVRRSALAAFGTVSVQGLLDLYADLYTTRFHEDNLGSNRVTAGVASHLNPTSAPRAQNSMYTSDIMNSYFVEVTADEAQGSNHDQVLAFLSPPEDSFNALLNDNRDAKDFELVPGSQDGKYFSNRNAMGISQQQLGERNTVHRVRTTTLVGTTTVYATEEDPIFVEADPDNPNEASAVLQVLPSRVQVITDQGGAQPLYTLLAVGYYSGETQYNNPPHGVDVEYLLFAFSRPLTLWGDSYIGRTVVLNLSVDGGFKTETGYVTGVIAHIEDSQQSGVTFIAVAPVTARFDRRSSFNLVGRGVVYEYPDSFQSVVSGFIDRAAIDPINEVPSHESPISWDDWFAQAGDLGGFGVTRVELDLRVQGREWVLNASQAFVSDRLFVCNDIGGTADLRLRRDGTLVTESPNGMNIDARGDVLISGDDVTIDADGAINLDNNDGIYQNGKPLIPATEVTANGYITVASPEVFPSGHIGSTPLSVFATLTHDSFVDNTEGNVHPFYLRGMPVNLAYTLKDPTPSSLDGYHKFNVYDATDVMNWFFGKAPSEWSGGTQDNYPSDTIQPLTPPGTMRLAFLGQALGKLDMHLEKGTTYDPYENLIISCEGWHHSNELQPDGTYWRLSDVQEYVAVVYTLRGDTVRGDAIDKVYGFITDASADPQQIRCHMSAYDGDALHFVGTDKDPAVAMPDLKIYASLYGVSASNNIISQFDPPFNISEQTQNESGDPYVNDWRQFLHYDWDRAIHEYEGPSAHPARLPSFMDNKLGPHTKEEDIYWVYTYEEYVEDTDNDSTVSLPPELLPYNPVAAITKDSWTYVGSTASQDGLDATFSVLASALSLVRVSSDEGTAVDVGARNSTQNVFRYTVDGQQYEVTGVEIHSNYVDNTPGKAHIDPVGNNVSSVDYRDSDNTGYPSGPIVAAMSAQLNVFQTFSGKFTDSARWFDVGRAHTTCMLDYLLSSDVYTQYPYEYRHMFGSPLWGILDPYPINHYPTEYTTAGRAPNKCSSDIIPAIVGVYSNIRDYYESVDPTISYGTRGADEYGVTYVLTSPDQQPSILGKYVTEPTLRRNLLDQVTHDNHSVSRYGSASYTTTGAYVLNAFSTPAEMGEYYVRKRTTDNVGTRILVASGKYTNHNKSDYPLWVAHTYNLLREDVDYPLQGTLRQTAVVDIPSHLSGGAYPATYDFPIFEEILNVFISELYKLNSAMIPFFSNGVDKYRDGSYVQGAKAWLNNSGKQGSSHYLNKDAGVTTDVAEIRVRLNREQFDSWLTTVVGDTPYTQTPYKHNYTEMAPNVWESEISGAFLGVKPLVIPITVKLHIRIV